MKVKKISERWENGNTCYVKFEYNGYKFECFKCFSDAEKKDPWHFTEDLNPLFIGFKDEEEEEEFRMDLESHIIKIEDAVFP